MTEQEFLRAYDEYADRLFRYSLIKVSNREQARDIVQETFTHTWSFIVEGGRIHNIKAFLYRTTNNLIIDWYRKKKSVSLDQLVEQGFNPRDNKENPEFASDVKQAIKLIEKIDDPYREALVLRFVEDLSPSEIAETLGVSANVVSVRINRGLEKLRNLMTS